MESRASTAVVAVCREGVQQSLEALQPLEPDLADSGAGRRFVPLDCHGSPDGRLRVATVLSVLDPASSLIQSSSTMLRAISTATATTIYSESQFQPA